MGVCDGVWVLARAGLLEGRNATGHWYSLDDLRKDYPKTNWLRGKRYVADGKVVTTTGVTATIPVSFALVEAIKGRERALALAKSLGIERVSKSREPIVSLRGLTIVPDRVANIDAPRRMLDAPRTELPLRSLDGALGRIASTFGERTAGWL